MVRLSMLYGADGMKKKYCVLIRKTSPIKTKPSNSVLDIPSASCFRCFFGKDAKRDFQSKKYCSSILTKKIASIGVWGNGRFPLLNVPNWSWVMKAVKVFKVVGLQMILIGI